MLLLCVVFLCGFIICCSYIDSELIETVDVACEEKQKGSFAVHLNRCSCDSSEQPESSETKPAVLLSAELVTHPAANNERKKESEQV